MHKLLCSVALLLASALAWAGEIPVADFARNQDLRGVIKISPDSKYLAEIRLEGGNDYLAIQRLSDHKISGGLKLGNERRVRQFWWAGDTVIVAFGEKFETLKEPRWTGELVSVDAEASSGKPLRYVFGGRSKAKPFVDRSEQFSVDPDYFSSGWVVRNLPGDPDSAMIEVNDHSHQTNPNYSEVRRINTITGSGGVVAQAPVRGFSDFLVDAHGNARYVYVVDNDMKPWHFIKPEPDGDWKQLAGLEYSGIDTVLDLVSSDDRRAFLRSYEGGDSFCLVEQMLDGSARRKLSCEPQLDISGVVMSFDDKEPIAALYYGAPPWERILPTANPDAEKLRTLMNAFPGQIVIPVSQTTDGSKVVLLVSSARSPGDFYLFEPKTMHADLIGSLSDWIDPEQMSEVQPIEFKARDGQVLHGFLTIPRGKDPKKLPLVVHPHGGPFGEMDTWRYDPQTQLLASRGYAVLQVNFRGSGGYGQRFEEVARRRWGSLMIDDITDGTRWAIQRGVADPARICIFGASYGGYASLMSAVREPDLYRCVVGYSGVYDLSQLISDSDSTNSWYGLNYAREYIGADAEHLKADSPINYLDKLKAAVMIVHGDDDPRAPYTQAKLLRAALDARHYPYEWLVKVGEGHGFYLQQDREEFFNKLLAFLDKNIGGGAAADKQTASTVDAAKPAAPAN